MSTRKPDTGTPAFRPRSEVHDWAESLPEAYLLCRDIGHLWRPFTAKWMPQLNAYQRTLRCGRCGTERSQYVGPTGSISGGSYSYAEGYEAPRGAGRVNSEGRDEMRLTAILRLLGADEGA